MRHLMGFLSPDCGTVRINGMDCRKEQKNIQINVGYLPGEISSPNDMTGTAYIRLIAKMRKMKDLSHIKELLDYLEINPDTGFMRMSKGMKQKIGIVTAFMHDPELLLLDEPTSGLDPLMQNKFIDMIKKSKERGKTILLSSHIFEEVEKTCDRVGMIRNGKLICQLTTAQFRDSAFKTYNIGLKDQISFEKVKSAYPGSQTREDDMQVIVSINDSRINELLGVLSQCNVKFLKEEQHTLEDYFMKFYVRNQ